MNNAFNAESIFWLLAGILIGIATALTFGRWWNARAVTGNRPVFMLSVAGSLAFAATAFLLYGYLGRPDAVSGVAAHLSPGASDAKSMEEVTSQLAARLATNSGTDQDWTLLAQSYEFMGRTADAEQTRARKLAAPAVASSDSSDFIAIANAHRQQRNYAAARAAFESAIQHNAMTAASWADYADTLASMQQGTNKLAGAAQAIERALALDPNHTKALWLKASLAHEERRYADALALWKRLRTVVRDSESDARIIDANIAEAEQLLAQAHSAPKAATPAAIAGTVEVDPKLAARIAPGSTLFIYAKAIDSPGPPLAVMRTPVTQWPVNFKLDDSMAMLPNRNLSSVAEVIVAARISKSGMATAAAGDLQTAGMRANARSGKALRLRIDREAS